MQSAHNGYYKGSIPFGLNNYKYNKRELYIKYLILNMWSKAGGIISHKPK
jgi:hypothetical protein